MFGNLKELPKPIGKYTVGVLKTDFLDKSRQKVFSFEKDDAFREIPVAIFYPSDGTERKETAPYASVEEIESLSKMTKGLVSKKTSQTKTCFYDEVPISTSEERFPVIMYSHGYGSYLMQDATLLTNLASLGYIVVSIGHPYESGCVKYLDGRAIKINESIMNDKKPSKEDLKTEKKLYKKQKKCSDAKSMEMAVMMNEIVCSCDSVKIWESDSRFIADKLELLDKGIVNSILAGKLKLELGIGIMGHSFGGTTAAQVCLNDSRFSCGINLDGGTYGDYLYKDIKKPFMIVGGDWIENLARTTFIHNTEDTYMTIIKGAKHFAFADAVFIARQMNLLNLLGKRDKFEFHEIYTTYTIKFFEKYLLGNKNIELKDIKYNEVKFMEKKKK